MIKVRDKASKSKQFQENRQVCLISLHQWNDDIARKQSHYILFGLDTYHQCFKSGQFSGPEVIFADIAFSAYYLLAGLCGDCAQGKFRTAAVEHIKHRIGMIDALNEYKVKVTWKCAKERWIMQKVKGGCYSIIRQRD